MNCYGNTLETHSCKPTVNAFDNMLSFGVDLHACLSFMSVSIYVINGCMLTIYCRASDHEIIVFREVQCHIQDVYIKDKRIGSRAVVNSKIMTSYLTILSTRRYLDVSEMCWKHC